MSDTFVLLRADIAWMENNRDAYEELTNPIVDARPNDAKLHYRRGVALMCRNDLSAAKASLQKSSRQPKPPERAGAALAAVNEIVDQKSKFEGFVRTKNIEFADITFNRTQNASDQFCERNSTLGASVMLLEYKLAVLKNFNNTELLRMLDAMIALAPKAHDLLFERGNVNLALKEFDAAIFDFNVLRSENPNNKEAGAAFEKAMQLKKQTTHVDYYAILGARKTATTEEITQAYKKRVREWHPDRFPDPEKKSKAEAMMKKVNTAYDILKDERKRRIYDAGGGADEIDEQADGPGGGFSFADFFGGADMEGSFESPFGDFFAGGEGMHFEFQFGG
jgi:tetratricopeptide (TPR) repeat protein